MGINGLGAIVKPLVRELRSGITIVTEKVGNTTMTRIFNKEGTLVNTRSTEIFRSPTRTSVKKTYVNKDQETVIINNITCEKGTKLSTLDTLTGEKSYYDGHKKMTIENDSYPEFLPDSHQELKTVFFNNNGVREWTEYSPNMYGKQTSSSFFPPRGGDGFPLDVEFNKHGIPTKMF